MPINKSSVATYVLVIEISKDFEIIVGKLGKVFFKKGNYIYIGSAKACLEARLRRHLKKDKKSFWHIDYLLKSKKTKILQIWIIDKKMECQTAEVFCQDPTTEIIKKGFGSSDCKCVSHLFYIKNKELLKNILKEMGFSIYYSFSKFRIDNLLGK
ncbi:MAG: GIY-YIG nuclease family protein [Atribacterota bacterium]